MDLKDKLIVLALSTSLAIPAEGLRNWAYRDPPGVPSICLGSTKGVRMGDFRTNAECYALLDKEMLEVIDAVEKCLPGLPTNVHAALSDFAYNVGTRAVCDTSYSTLARKFKAGDITGGCNQLPRWNKSTLMGVKVVLPGLTRRREKERELCLS